MKRAAPIVLLLIASCAGPRPSIPAKSAVTAPSGWRTNLGATLPIAADWWRIFGDPVLPGLVDRAVVSNSDLGIAAARVEEARAQERLSRAQLLPLVNASVTGADARALNPFGVATTNQSLQPAITAGYDLDLFGRLRQANAAARAQLLASKGARDTVRLAVVASVVSGYITLRALDARLTVARETLAARGEALHIARRRADAGYTSRLELRQAQAEYAATEQLVPQVQLAISRQENALGVLLGGNPGTIERGMALDRLITPSIPDGLPADLLRRRPDLFQAEQTLVAADHSLDSARAALLPNLSLTGSAGLILSTALHDPVGVYSLGGSILGPIFDGGRLRAQSSAAAARRDQAAFAYQKAALTAFREVDDSLAGVQRLGEQAAAVERQRTALAAGLRNATNRYRAGYSSYLDQLDTQRGLLTAELALVQARADRLTAYVQLYQAMGGGWIAPQGQR